MHNYCPHRELTNRKCYKRKKLIDLTLYIECNIYVCVCVSTKVGQCGFFNALSYA